jgi:hypothetical protein
VVDFIRYAVEVRTGVPRGESASGWGKPRMLRRRVGRPMMWSECMWVMNILFTFATWKDLPPSGWSENCRTVPSAPSTIHNDPSPTISSTREEQLRDSLGPPPEEVPKKKADIHCDMDAEPRSRPKLLRRHAKALWRRQSLCLTTTHVRDLRISENGKDVGEIRM